MRIGVALVQQETNTFSLKACRLDEFTIRAGLDAGRHTSGTNSEMGGAVDAIGREGHEPVPLIYAWALPSGRVDDVAFARLRTMLTESIAAAGPLDGLVLALHGSMATATTDDADGAMIEAAREVAGPIPLVVGLDLHANVTRRMVATADAIVGYHTDPHVDMADTGGRAARLVIAMAAGRTAPVTVLAKRPMIVPAESMNTTTGPLAGFRREADALADVLDVSFFPVQPWLDVAELGLGVLVTTDGDAARARDLAESFAGRIWEDRHRFVVPRLRTPAAALTAARASRTRPFIVAESADAPTAGAAGDSPAMVAALRTHGAGLKAVVPVVDPAAVDRCLEAGRGAVVDLEVGASIDRRWWKPVPLHARVEGFGEGPYRLEGAGYTGLTVDMGRWAVVRDGDIVVLLSERPAWTADPATFRTAGIDLAGVDVLVVRSCSDFRPNFPDAANEAVTLDVPGPATPRLDTLTFSRAGRPLWPLDPFADDRGHRPPPKGATA
jgi:microcystin degradation protein MlrC